MTPGPNDRLPCPSDSAKRRHLAQGRGCTICGVPGPTHTTSAEAH